MHIQKSLSVFCVVACVGAGSLALHAEDTDVQARAREALRQKMAEVNGQTGRTNAEPPAVVVTLPEQSAPSASAAVPAPAAPATSSVSGTLTPEQEAKVREALRQALASQNGQQPATAATVVVQPAVAAPAQPQPVVNVQEAAPQAPAVISTAPAYPGAPHQLTPEEQQRVLEAERTELARLRTTEAKQNADAKAKVKVAPVKSIATSTPAPVPATTTMAPAQGSKEQRLNELLQLYKADKITPVEYHQERAKILGE